MALSPRMVAIWVTAALAAYFLLTAPVQAAELVRGLASGLAAGAGRVTVFLRDLIT